MRLGILSPFSLAAWAALALAGAHCFGAAILQLRVVEGEGAVSAVGSRGTRGITVQVTDETGAPVEGAAVSFRLPAEGPGGAFPGNLKSTLVTTRPDGKASVWGMQWNRLPGPFEVHITAVKDKARAGIVCQQYLSDKVPVHAGGNGTFAPDHHYKKWLIAAGLVGAGVLGGVAFAGRKGQAAAPISTTALGPPSIGAPTITVGPHP